jgi:hypothetical protein
MTQLTVVTSFTKETVDMNEAHKFSPDVLCVARVRGRDVRIIAPWTNVLAHSKRTRLIVRPAKETGFTGRAESLKQPIRQQSIMAVHLKHWDDAQKITKPKARLKAHA